MRLKKKAFRKVCRLCMNTRVNKIVKKCPSETCLLAPVKDGKPFRATVKLMKDFCKSCDPEGYNVRSICETIDGCPLQPYYNRIWAKSGITPAKRRKRASLSERVPSSPLPETL